jgi:MraZ protein
MPMVGAAKGGEQVMSHFLGTHQNRLDSKGRISIPAPFRTALKAAATEQAGAGLVLRPSHNYPCIEAWPAAVFETLASPLQSLEQFGEPQDDMALFLYADATAMEPDREGRIVLPGTLVQHAGLADQAVFMGLGRTFQIWEPEAAERRRTEARERASQRRMTLPGTPTPSAPKAGAA